MKRTAYFLAALASAGVADAGYDSRTWNDPANDAVPRPTDAGLTGSFNASALPDLIALTISAWDPFDPVADPYSGTLADKDNADIFKIDLALNGLFNPPGPLGLGAGAWEPFRFGSRPVYGFVELDVDRENETGGELGAAARNRYLANVGRFASRPNGSIGERMVQGADDLDANVFTTPYFERSGAEFDLGFCGCSNYTLVSETGNANGTMEAGETFIVQGRFFRRVAAFASVSGMEGGSFGGHYDPIVNIRFSHDLATDTTTITFVGSLTMAGAAALIGQPEQQDDFLVDNHWSVYECLYDIRDGAEGLNGPIPPEVGVLISNWAESSLQDSLDPTRWRPTVLIGTTYTTPNEAIFVWTDVGVSETVADYTGDGIADAADLTQLLDHISDLDGTASDADGTQNGAVTVFNPGQAFDAFDITGNSVVDSADANYFNQPIAADLNSDGAVNAADLATLLAAWSLPGVTDLNTSGSTDAADLAILLAAWGSH